MVFLFFLFLGIPVADAAPIMFARYNNDLNTRVCLSAARMERIPDPELITAQERWAGIESFIRNHVPKDFQDNLFQSEMNCAGIAYREILLGGRYFLDALPQCVFERDYLLPLCRVLSTFQYLLVKRVGQDRINGDLGTIKLPLMGLHAVCQVTQILFKSLIGRSLISSSDLHGYLCHEYRAGQLAQYWFHKNSFKDPLYEIFLAPEGWLSFVHFASFEVSGYLYSKSMLFNEGKLVETPGILAYSLSRGKNLEVVNTEVAYIAYVGSSGCLDKKSFPSNLPSRYLHPYSTYPCLEEAVNHFWQTQPDLKKNLIFFMSKPPLGRERLNAAFFLEYCCWVLDDEREQESRLADLFRSEIVTEGATNFLDWIRQKIFRKDVVDDDFGDFLRGLLNQLERPAKNAEVSFYRKHFEKHSGCFAYPALQHKKKTSSQNKAEVCWAVQESRLHVLFRWSHYVILKYLGELKWEAFKNMAKNFYVDGDLDMENAAQCVLRFVAHLMERVMPQELFPSDARML